MEYKCSICDRGFKSYQARNAHMVSHKSGKRYRTYDWNEIQKFYDDNHTVLQVDEYFGCEWKSRKKAVAAGLFIMRDKSSQQISRKSSDISLERLTLIGKEYSNGNSQRDLYKMGFTSTEYCLAKEQGLLIPRTLSEANAISIKKYGTRSPGSEARKRLSIRQSLSNTGGRCKWYEVAGQRVQGTWERDFAQMLEENNILWYKPKVNKDVWHYTISGFEKSYTPDFYLPKYNVFIEIKGHWWGNDRQKMINVLTQNKDKSIVLLMKPEMDIIRNLGVSGLHDCLKSSMIRFDSERFHHILVNGA